MQSSSELPEILIVEDNLADRMLILEALKQGDRPHIAHVVEDGEAAMSMLKDGASGENRYRPNLIFLDLNLPKKDGYEVLEEIKADPELRTIPVVILTTSTSPQDVSACYKAGANCYVVKTFGLDNFMETVGRIQKFWLSIAMLPKKHNRIVAEVLP